MRFDFRTQTNLQPTVIDKWYVHVKSHADGIYDQFGCTGEITDNGYWKQVSLGLWSPWVKSVRPPRLSMIGCFSIGFPNWNRSSHIRLSLSCTGNNSGNKKKNLIDTH